MIDQGSVLKQRESIRNQWVVMQKEHEKPIFN